MSKITIPADEIKEILEIVYDVEAGSIKSHELFLKERIRKCGDVFEFIHEFIELFLGILMSGKVESEKAPIYLDAIRSIARKV